MEAYIWKKNYIIYFKFAIHMTIKWKKAANNCIFDSVPSKNFAFLVSDTKKYVPQQK